jgi:hypothetical protein
LDVPGNLEAQADSMRVLTTALFMLSAFVVTASVRAQDAAPGTLVLDQFGSWRMFTMLKPPEVAFDDGVRAVVFNNSEHYWLNGETPRPPQNWTSPDFDDSDWLRGPVGMGCRAPFVRQTCLRGKFRVSNPAATGPLTLALRFHGGAAVYLNGEEVGRSCLPRGADVADVYPS